MNIYCNNCDSIFTETTQFCPNCGTPTPFYYVQGGEAADSQVILTHPGIVREKRETDYSTVPQEISEKSIYVPHNPYSMPPPPPPPTFHSRRKRGIIIGITTFVILIPLLILSSFGVHDLLAQRVSPPSKNLITRPTATMVPKIATATATPAIAYSTPGINLTYFSSDGYSIGYPDGWTMKKEGTVIQIVRNDNVSMLIETVESPAGVSPQGGVQGALGALKGNSKKFQLKTVASPITLANTQWEQGAATADNPTTGANSTVYVITAKFPSNANKLIAIIYGAGTSEFDKDNTEAFQPMLQSFKFV